MGYLFQHFKALFRSDMKESQTGVVEVPDFTSSVMLSLVNYLYTGDMPEEHEFTLDFLKAADIYGEDELREAIEAKVKSSINLDNIMEILTASFSYNMPTLKKAALAFVCANMKSVKVLPEWKQLHRKHPLIATEIMETAFD